MNKEKTILENQIFAIAKNEENIHDFVLNENKEGITLKVLFELDEEDCLPAFKKLCAKISKETGKKYKIDEVFFEALFYL